MKRVSILIFLMTFALNPAFVLAHGDEEHEATLREAAAALKESRPDLAAKLEEMVKMHESMHGSMENEEAEDEHFHEHGNHAH